jgi:hypothetical protein
MRYSRSKNVEKPLNHVVPAITIITGALDVARGAHILMSGETEVSTGVIAVGSERIIDGK